MAVDSEGLTSSSLFFGTACFIYRIVQYILLYTASAFIIGFQTFLAVLVLGAQYRKIGSIIPSAASHTLLNTKQLIILAFLL